MRELFRYPCSTLGGMFIYFDNETATKVDVHNVFVMKLQWRYHNGVMQWKSTRGEGWVEDPDKDATIAYKAYIASLILENKE